MCDFIRISKRKTCVTCNHCETEKNQQREFAGLHAIRGVYIVGGRSLTLKSFKHIHGLYIL